jgi:hypothetical protein
MAMFRKQTGGSNEPAGMTVVMERPWNQLDTVFPYTDDVIGGSVGWRDVAGTANVSIVTDASAPKSPSNVGRMVFDTGLVEGNSPGTTGFTPPVNYRTTYTALWLKVSANWQGHGSSVNKLIHYFVGGSNRLYMNLWGVGAGALNLGFGLQGTVSNGPHGANVNQDGSFGGVFSRGVWHKIECVLIGNTSGNADGSLKWWLDGVLCGTESGIQFVAGNALWEDVSWSPTWGGASGDSIAAQMTMDMDHLYHSGK